MYNVQQYLNLSCWYVNDSHTSLLLDVMSILNVSWVYRSINMYNSHAYITSSDLNPHPVYQCIKCGITWVVEEISNISKLNISRLVSVADIIARVVWVGAGMSVCDVTNVQRQHCMQYTTAVVIVVQRFRQSSGSI